MHPTFDTVAAFLAGALVATVVHLLPDTINLTLVGSMAAIGGAVGMLRDRVQRSQRPTYAVDYAIAGFIVGLVIFVGYALAAA